jgi:transcriptional regulator with XRE-family HTH domain
MRAPGERDQLSVALGRVLATVRKDAGLTQEQLAYRCGMHPTTISHIERGLNSPTIRVVGSLARELGTSAASLLDLAERQLSA